MTETTKKLEISPIELDLIANALETQSKILCMQASAGGHGALARLNEVKRVLATIASHREDTSPPVPRISGCGGLCAPCVRRPDTLADCTAVRFSQRRRYSHIADTKKAAAFECSGLFAAWNVRVTPALPSPRQRPRSWQSHAAHRRHLPAHQ